MLLKSDVSGPLSIIWISVYFFPKAHLYHGSSVTRLFASQGFLCLPLILTSWEQKLLSSLGHLSVPLTGFLLFADLWDNRDSLGSSTSVSSFVCCWCWPALSSLLSLHRQGCGYRSCQSVLPDRSTWWLLPSLCLKRRLVLFLEPRVGNGVTDLSASMEAGNSLLCVFLLPNFDSIWVHA